nr:MAG TPA: hypothetical protein [Caudoviricetes sp.]
MPRNSKAKRSKGKATARSAKQRKGLDAIGVAKE